MFASLAGITAVTLGAIYTYGALIKMTVLWGADQKAADTLPLFSLEQLLLAGISELIPIGAIIVVFATVFFAASDAFRHVIRPRLKPSRKPQASPDGGDDPEEKVSRSKQLAAMGWRFLYGFAAAGAVVTILASPPSTAIVLAINWAFLAYGRLAEIRPGRAFLMSVLLLATTLFAVNAVHPDPLPTVTLQRTGRPPLEARLITRNDSTWYLAVAEKRFDAVPSSQVNEARVHSHAPLDDKSLFEQIFGGNS